MEGDAEEGAAWAKAFASAQPDYLASPLTDDERATVNLLILQAASEGDMDTMDELKQLAADPPALRRMLAKVGQSAE